jgi:predicted dehydrogenase
MVNKPYSLLIIVKNCSFIQATQYWKVTTAIMKKIYAALLGIEHPHSLAHLRTLQELPEVEAIYLWDENAAALESARQSQGQKIAGVYTELDDLLRHDEIFFVIAALRNDLGPAICLRVLEAGKHIMAEKPIGRTAPDVQKVVNAAERHGLQLSVCYQNRYSPVIRQMRSLAAEGIFGPLMTVEIRALTTGVRFRNPQHWLFSNEKAGGGMLSWLGCHYLDMMRYITGDEIVSVSAEVATRSGEDIDVEDVATLGLRFASGAIGSLHVGYTLALSGGGYHNKQGYDVYAGINGRAGRMHWSAQGSPSHLFVETSHPAWRDAPTREFSYVAGESPAYGGPAGEEFIRAFIRSAQGEGAPPTTGHDALQIARIVDAAYESSRSGRRIEIELPLA